MFRIDQRRNEDFAPKVLPPLAILAAAYSYAEDEELQESSEAQMEEVSHSKTIPTGPFEFSRGTQPSHTSTFSASRESHNSSWTSDIFSQSQTSEKSDYFGGSRDYFGDSGFFDEDGFYGEEKKSGTKKDDIGKIVGQTLLDFTPEKPLEQQHDTVERKNKGVSVSSKPGQSENLQTVEEFVEVQRQIHMQYNPGTYDSEGLPTTPPPSSPVAERSSPKCTPVVPKPSKKVPSTEDAGTGGSGLRRGCRTRTQFKPFQPPTVSPRLQKVQKSSVNPPLLEERRRGRPRIRLREMKGDRSTKAFWVRIVGVQVKWMRTMGGGGPYSRSEAVAFATDSWQLLANTFSSLDVKTRSQPMHKLVLMFLSNSVKMYELMTLKGFQEIFTTLPEFVRMVLKKYLAVPRRLYEQIPQWLQARDAIMMIGSHLTQNELILTVLSTVVDMQKRFLDTWTATASTPVDLNMDHVISGMQQIGEIVTVMNNRMAQARRVAVYGLMF